MTLQERDKRALAILGVSTLLSLAIYFWPVGSGTTVVQASLTDIPSAERRVAKLREIKSTVPGKQKLLDGLSAQLDEREKGIVAAQTAAQAQAQLVQTIRKLGRDQSPSMDIGQFDMGAIQPLGPDYGEALVSMSFNCRIEQLVNLLADIASHKDLIATHELQVRAGEPKQKLVAVRLTVSGVIPRKLVPERKGVTLF